LAFGETAAGAGLMMGPIIGGTLYVTFGYFWCYIILAAFLFFSMLFAAIVMPNSINKNGPAEEDEEEEESLEIKEMKIQQEKEFDRMSKQVSN
jgi:MFS family permease